jgi:hypothetical protein
LCGIEKELTFEHVPPRATGNNIPQKLYNGADLITDENRAPWDTRGLKYLNAQKGRGGYTLCAECNNTTGHRYAYALTDMFTQAAKQHVVPVVPKITRSMTWSIDFINIKPLNIAKQALLMIACVNYSGFLDARSEIRELIMSPSLKATNFPHGLQLFLNAGPMIVTYPVTARVRFGGTPDILTGLSSELFGFQLEMGRNTNPAHYTDITSWLHDYEYDEEASIRLQVPVYETHTMFPEDHRGKSEIELTKEANDRLYRSNLA